jgi:hypothetical protein
MHVDYVDSAGQEQVHDLKEGKREKDKECNETTDRMTLYERNTQSQLIARKTPFGSPFSHSILMSRVQEGDIMLFSLQIGGKIPDYGSHSSELLVPGNNDQNIHRIETVISWILSSPHSFSMRSASAENCLPASKCMCDHEALTRTPG